MSMTLDEKTIGVWFVDLSPMSDWLMTLGSTDDGTYTVTHRFRYYVDDKAHDSDDRKSWYSGTIKKSFGDIEKVIDTMRTVVHKLAKRAGNVAFHEILMTDAGLDDFMERFQDMPFVHVEKHMKGEIH